MPKLPQMPAPSFRTAMESPPPAAPRTGAGYWTGRRLVTLAIAGPLVAGSVVWSGLNLNVEVVVGVAIQTCFLLLIAGAIGAMAVAALSPREPRTARSGADSAGTGVAAILALILVAVLTGWWLGSGDDC